MTPKETEKKAISLEGLGKAAMNLTFVAAASLALALLVHNSSITSQPTVKVIPTEFQVTEQYPCYEGLPEATFAQFCSHGEIMYSLEKLEP